MAQFGRQKNPPPWATQFTATAVSQPAPLPVQQSSMFGASPPIYTQQSALAAAGLTSSSPANYQLTQTAALQQQAAAALQQQYAQPQQTIYSVPQQLQQPQQTIYTQPTVALPTSLALSTPQPAAQITVSYPTPRSSQQQTQPQKQRVFTGVVSKLHETFGFVDEDVFFQLTAVKGKSPQTGDRVLVEATYNPNMPFKWNAQRIQTLPNQNPAPVQPMIKNPPGVMQPVAQPTAYAVQTQPPPQAQTLFQAQISAATLTPLLQTQPSPLIQQPQQKAGLLQIPVRISSQPQPVRRIEPPPSRFSGRSDRGDLISSRKDDRSRERERHRSRDRSPQRKRSRERSPRRERERSPRRPRRVVPRYTVQFSKFSLDCPGCDTMELRRRYQNLYIPSDFFDTQFTWVDAFPISRSFQLGNYSNFYIMNKEVDPLEKNTAIVDPPDADHTYSVKVMLLASPSLEELYHKSCALAEDPIEVREGFQHPARLIKFLVGMKGKDEAMAIGGHWSPSLDGPNPDKDPSVLIRTAVRCCKALTGIELSLCTQWYRFAEIRYHRPEETHKGRTVPAHVETVVLFFPDVWHCLPTRSEWENLCRGYKQQLVDKLQGDRKEADGEQEEEDKDGDAKEISTPTHWSKLDPKIMKVNDLRKELESRTLSSKGLKSQLIARLTKQLRIEEQKEQKELEKCVKQEEEEEERKSEDDKEDEEQKRQEELERQRREKRYVLPDEPAIIVHPNWSAKNGKFDCSIMSLSVLLDYRIEDNKEHAFEVSLFAELFNEMLQRDFGVRIYRELLALPEKEEKKDKEKKCKKEDKGERKEDKDEDDEPKPKRRKSSEDQIKLEEKEERKRDDGRKEDYREEDDLDYENQDDDEPIAAEEDDCDFDDRENDDDDSSSKDKREDKRDGNRCSKEQQSKDKEKDKKKMVTVNRDLLMAFVYFDQSHCGYLLEKDLEEILYTLGLHLSRAQVKKLFTRILLKESLLYRKLTDMATEDGSHEETDPLHSDILGNCSLLPSKAVRTGLSTVEDKGGLIVYKGAMVAVGSLLQKLEKSEKTRSELEHRLQTLESKTVEDEKTISQLEATKQNLSEELKQTKDDLGHLKDSLKAAEDTRSLYENQLTNSIKNLSAAMEEIQVVLNQNPSPTEDQKSKENGSS